MKIIILCFLGVFLVSCGISQEKESLQNTASWELTAASSGTWSTASGSQTEAQNVVPQNNKKLEKHDDGNIYLYENWKQIEYLTTKAEKCIDRYGAWENDCMGYVNYEIVNAQWNYGVVHKHTQGWECGSDVFYGYNLNGNSSSLTELYEVWYCFLQLKSAFNWNTLEVYVEYPEYIVETPENKWEIEISFIKSEGFVQKWDTWVKTIDVAKLLPDIKEPQPQNTQKSSSWDAKYQHQNLVAQGFKVNKLGSITEYYKTESTFDGMTQEEIMNHNHPWFKYYSVIYVQGDAVLDMLYIVANDNSSIDLQINNPQSKTPYVVKSMYDYADYWESPDYPLFPIFWKTHVKIIISDINTVKLVNTEKNLSQTLWKR